MSAWCVCSNDAVSSRLAFDILNYISENNTLVQLMDLLINVNHAIGIVGHWIFDSNYNKALFLTQKSDPVDTCDNFSCQLTEAFHVFYNMQSDDKFEN